MNRTAITMLLAAMMLGACSDDRHAAPATAAVPQAAATANPLAPVDNRPLARGEARLAVDGGRIWYRQTGGGDGTPVILVHGGPGFASYYMASLEAIGADRPVIRYDQLGAGRSDRLVDTSKMTIAHFVEELEALRAHLGYDRFHLVGHSWGTILGIEYYRTYPQHVASLVLAGPVLDMPAWARHTKELVATLSPEARRAIRVREAEHNYAAPDYQQALMEFYGKYVWRAPNQAELDMLMKTVNDGIYNFMQGPSEFTITGTLGDYDATPYLKDVHVPVLYLVGEFDEAGPELVRGFAERTPGARFHVIPGAAHIFEWDNPGDANRELRGFLREVDGRAASATHD